MKRKKKKEKRKEKKMRRKYTEDKKMRKKKEKKKKKKKKKRKRKKKKKERRRNAAVGRIWHRQRPFSEAVDSEHLVLHDPLYIYSSICYHQVLAPLLVANESMQQ